MNNKQGGRIGWGQAAIVLAISRVLSEAAAVPETTLEYGMQRYSVILVSFALTLLAYVPIYLTTRYCGGAGLIEAAAGGSRHAARVIGVLFIAGLMTAMTETFVRLNFYAASTIFDAAASPLLFIIITLICLYALFKGLQATARVGVLTAAGYLLLILLTVAALIPSIRLERMYIAFAERPSEFIGEVITEFSHNSEILIFAALCGRVRSHAARAVPVYIGLSCAALLLMTFLYNTVLGEYLGSVNFPFYALASLSDIAVFRRLNGIDVMVWVMAAAVKITLFALSVREVVLQGFRSTRAANVTAGITLTVSAAMAFLLVSDVGVFEILLGFISTGIPLLILSVPIPLAAMAAASLKKRKERFTE